MVNYNSVILSAIFSAWSFIKRAYENSIYFKIFTKIMDFFGGLYKKSGVYSLFSKVKPNCDESTFSKVVNWFFGLFYKSLHSKFEVVSKSVKKSIIAKSITSFINSWYAISVRYYSLALAVFVCFRLILKRLLSEMAGPYTFILMMLAVIGILIDASPAALYEGSKLRKIIGFADLPERIMLKKRITPHKAVTIAIITGTVLGLCTVVPTGWLLICGVCGTILLMVKPVVGVAVISTCFPFLPTMGVVALGAYLLASMFIKYLCGDSEKVKVDLFDGAILIMCGVILYGVVNSYAFKGSIPPAAVYILFISTFFVIRRAAKDKNFFMCILNLIITVSVGVALYGIYQKITGQAETTWQDTEMFEGMGGRIYSTFGNPNVFGEYLLMVIPITFGMMINREKNNIKVLYFIALALQFVCMILTYSRGCWIGIAVAMAIMILFTSRKLTSLMVFAVLLAPLFVPETIVQRLLSIGNVSDTSTSYRVYIWQGTIRMLKDFWYCGVGIGEEAFRTVYPIYSLNAISAPHAHNLYLHILSETGIIGIVTVVGLLVLFYKYISTAAIKKSENKVIAVALGSSMIGYLIQGMFDNVWYNYRIYFFFFVVLALGAALYDISMREDTK